jgi:prepilin-type N-terminal cleavage/methylation domain-containing protein
MKKIQSAFTLVELMVTIVVVAILVGVALPSMRMTLLNNRVTERTNRLIGVLNYARTEALTRNAAVIIQPKEEDWNKGWSVILDQNNDGLFDETDPNEKLASLTLESKGVEIQFPTDDETRYNGRGRFVPPRPYSIIVCSTQESEVEARIVTIGNSSSISVERTHNPCTP